MNDLLLINDLVSGKQEIAFVEVCCGTNSALRDACRVARMPYVGVVKEVETGAVSFSGAAFPIAFSTRFSLRAD